METESEAVMKTGPVEKIYEAYSAIADERVTLKDDHGEVFSSDRKKAYTVTFKDDVYASDDNATYWQGYAGYPVLAVLFLQGRLPLNMETAQQFRDINWHELNEKFKRDYHSALESVMKERQLDQEKIAKETSEVYDRLKRLDISIRRGKSRTLK